MKRAPPKKVSSLLRPETSHVQNRQFEKTSPVPNMPHKHKRKHDGDKNKYVRSHIAPSRARTEMTSFPSFDLPPTKIAKPLSAYEQIAKKHHKKGSKPNPAPPPSNKRKRNATSNYKGDDTPRAFARIMQHQSGSRPFSGLDNGERKKGNPKEAQEKKKKKTRTKYSTMGESETDHSQAQATDQAAQAVVENTASKLKVQPGERLSDFAARVNQALPLSGLSRKGKAVEGVKERQTKTEKRLQRMYAEWREQEQKRKDREEEFLEAQEEKDAELQTELGGQSIHLTSEGRKAKRKRMLTEAVEGDDDPWAVLKTKRDAPRGLHDVVQAPPQINVVPKEKFRVKDGARVEVSNVPGKSGSLKRREELGEARR